MLLLMVAYASVMGACLASFACVVSERVPAGVSINGRSQCACGRQLRAVENIPVLGWLRARRGAACCGSRPPARYVVAEAGAAVWSGAVAAGAYPVLDSGHLALAVAGVLAGLVTGTLVVVVATWQGPRDR